MRVRLPRLRMAHPQEEQELDSQRTARHSRTSVARPSIVSTPALLCIRTKFGAPQLSEPILVPKVRILFADFPYKHYTCNQWLLAKETCCGFRYEPTSYTRTGTRAFFGCNSDTQTPDTIGAMSVIPQDTD